MRVFTGIVVSTKMAKTVVVERVISRPHPLYMKTMRRRRRLKAHSDIPLKVGDKIKVVPTRPMSKEKHFRVVGKVV